MKAIESIAEAKGDGAGERAGDATWPGDVAEGLHGRLPYKERRPRGLMTVQHDPERSRFFVTLPDGDAELVYAPFSDDILELQHTEVPPSGQGHGVGDALVRAALAYARERNLHVIATCPYVQAWLRRHPEARLGGR